MIQHEFQAHRDLLRQVMTRQAGSLSKALLEGAMNSADAGATQCVIDLSEIKDGILVSATIKDNGRGFQSAEEIEQNFRTLGQPQTEEEQQRKLYGTFRIGRGQMFSFGKNTWRSGNWELVTDIQEFMGYQQNILASPVAGCEIEIQLYTEFQQPPNIRTETANELRHWCRWMPLEVKLITVAPDGSGEPLIETVSNDPNEFEWTHETEDAYVALDSSSRLAVYNNGVHVRDFDQSRFGTGGEIVTRTQLKVNFARNDVQRDCPIWKRIEPLVNQWAKTRMIQRKQRWGRAERQKMARAVLADEYRYSEFSTMPLFTAVTGRHYNFVETFTTDRWKRRISVDDMGSRIGDSLHRSGVAFVLAQETLDRFGWASAKEAVNWATYICPQQIKDIEIVSFDELKYSWKTEYRIFEAKELHRVEQIWLTLITRALNQTLYWSPEIDQGTIRSARRQKPREIMIGVGPAYGWTDGRSYVVINRDWLNKHRVGLPGFLIVGDLLLHEFCHQELDTNAHEHDQAFYELYHDSVSEFMPLFVDGCLRVLPRVLHEYNKKASKLQLREQDRLAIAARVSEEL